MEMKIIAVHTAPAEPINPAEQSFVPEPVKYDGKGSMLRTNLQRFNPTFAGLIGRWSGELLYSRRRYCNLFQVGGLACTGAATQSGKFSS